MTRMGEAHAGWDEANSRSFLNCGRYFVPDRDRQIGIIADLIRRCQQVRCWSSYAPAKAC
jgi:hypothetical protein